MPGHSSLEGTPAFNAQGDSRMPQAVRREPLGVQPYIPEYLLELISSSPYRLSEPQEEQSFIFISFFWNILKTILQIYQANTLPVSKKSLVYFY
jgi:hypothetical protein